MMLWVIREKQQSQYNKALSNCNDVYTAKTAEKNWHKLKIEKCTCLFKSPAC